MESGVFQPDIGGVLAAVNRISRVFQALKNGLRILHIIIDLSLQLRLSFRGINGFAGSLNDVRSSVVFGAMASCPQIG